MPKKVKTESVALFNHKFEAIRPFGPTIIRGKVPMDLIHLLDKKASKLLGSKHFPKNLIMHLIWRAMFTKKCVILHRG